MSSTKIEMPTRPVAPPARPHGGWARSLVMRRLASLARGSLTVLEHGTRTHFEGTEPGPLATLEVRDALLKRAENEARRLGSPSQSPARAARSAKP